ncbi:MAG: methylmalonyl Co-A mutase-associated GTPase MeaB [Polyangiaceae bacterium]|nr:methylmalonyl Co-A mutase-associated GTPase MeaB [Polyangiaceae bacterium]
MTEGSIQESSSIAERVAQGDLRSLARLLRFVDDRSNDYQTALKALFPRTGKAFIVGITGNPGAGKSTLTDRLVEAYRKMGKTVAVLCVDPSSPFSGGAILGDRIRMNRHSTDPGVFIRSVATRGHMGGLSRSARDMIRVLDAYGFDVVLVETVGVGQDELEITRTAHTTLVVMAPGLGDDIQAIKAGLLECADVFAVNKADRDGADSTVRDLELMIALGRETFVASSKGRGHVVHSERDGAVESALASGTDARWTPPIHKCVALRNEGVADVVASLEKHREWIATSEDGKERRLRRLREEMREAFREALIEDATRRLGTRMTEAAERVAAKEIDPYTLVEGLVEEFRG